MEEFAALQSFAEIAQWLWDEVVRWVMLFVSPGWRQYQLFIIIGLIGAAFLLRLIVAPRVEAWARSRSGWLAWPWRWAWRGAPTCSRRRFSPKYAS